MFASMSSGVICSVPACACDRKKRTGGFLLTARSVLLNRAGQVGQIGQDAVRSREHIIKAKYKFLCCFQSDGKVKRVH